MSRSHRQFVSKRTAGRALAPPLLLAFVMGFPGGAVCTSRFVRVYSTPNPAHLTINNRDGDITLTAWSRREVSVRATCPRQVEVQDSVVGGAIDISVSRPRMTPVDFEIWAPGDTSVAVKTTMGRINISGITGHISVDTVDGDLHITGVKSGSVEAKVIRGDIYFDGELAGDGPYSLQSMHGDIDVMLPDSGSFDLVAKSLYDNINLGGFLLSPLNQKNEFISGKHDRGGPRLNLTAFEGHIMLHKK